jgi:hypothetical protein
VSPDPEDRRPATLHLEAYLESLRDDPPRPDPKLVPSIIRRARWQRIVRAPLHAAGSLFGALADGIAVILGPGSGRRS